MSPAAAQLGMGLPSVCVPDTQRTYRWTAIHKRESYRSNSAVANPRFRLAEIGELLVSSPTVIGCIVRILARAGRFFAAITFLTKPLIF